MPFNGPSDLLPVGLPPSPDGQRAHPDRSVWVRLGAEQQADWACLLQFIGQQPESAWRVIHSSYYPGVFRR